MCFVVQNTCRCVMSQLIPVGDVSHSSLGGNIKGFTSGDGDSSITGVCSLYQTELLYQLRLSTLSKPVLWK